MYNQEAINHLKQRLFHEMKHHNLFLEQGQKTNYMDEYIKAVRNQIASLNDKFIFSRGEIKERRGDHSPGASTTVA